MTKLKGIDYKILSELLKNSKMSDRKLAKKIGVSQPTVTRRRARLEKDVIDGYTLVPKWEKLGYEMLAFTLVKAKEVLGLKDKTKVAHDRGRKWLMKQPNVLIGGGCRGMGVNSFMISVHKSYSDFESFMVRYNRELGDMFSDSQTIIVNLGGNQILKPLHLKYLAEAIQASRTQHY